MKKTLFSGLAVVAIVSAALAFAPAKVTPDIYTTNPNDGNKCNLIQPYKADPLGDITLNGPFSQGALTTACPTATIQVHSDN